MRQEKSKLVIQAPKTIVFMRMQLPGAKKFASVGNNAKKQKRQHQFGNGWLQGHRRSGHVCRREDEPFNAETKMKSTTM